MTKTVILVEDDPDDEKLIRLAFKKSSQYRLLVARDGEEALKFIMGLDAQAGPVGVMAFVIMDLQLPKISGLEVLKRLRSDERTKALPVIVLTSSKEPRDRNNCYRSGANSYVHKAVDVAKFIEAIQYIEQYWLNINEPPEISAAAAISRPARTE